MGARRVQFTRENMCKSGQLLLLGDIRDAHDSVRGVPCQYLQLGGRHSVPRLCTGNFQRGRHRLWLLSMRTWDVQGDGG